MHLVTSWGVAIDSRQCSVSYHTRRSEIELVFLSYSPRCFGSFEESVRVWACGRVGESEPRSAWRGGRFFLAVWRLVSYSGCNWKLFRDLRTCVLLLFSQRLAIRGRRPRSLTFVIGDTQIPVYMRVQRLVLSRRALNPLLTVHDVPRNTARYFRLLLRGNLLGLTVSSSTVARDRPRQFGIEGWERLSSYLILGRRGHDGYILLTFSGGIWWLPREATLSVSLTCMISSGLKMGYPLLS